jgi:hypothetical protein
MNEEAAKIIHYLRVLDGAPTRPRVVGLKEAAHQAVAVRALLQHLCVAPAEALRHSRGLEQRSIVAVIIIISTDGRTRHKAAWRSCCLQVRVSNSYTDKVLFTPLLARIDDQPIKDEVTAAKGALKYLLAVDRRPYLGFLLCKVTSARLREPKVLLSPLLRAYR